MPLLGVGIIPDTRAAVETPNDIADHLAEVKRRQRVQTVCEVVHHTYRQTPASTELTPSPAPYVAPLIAATMSAAMMSALTPTCE